MSSQLDIYSVEPLADLIESNAKVRAHSEIVMEGLQEADFSTSDKLSRALEYLSGVRAKTSVEYYGKKGFCTDIEKTLREGAKRIGIEVGLVEHHRDGWTNHRYQMTVIGPVANLLQFNYWFLSTVHPRLIESLL